MRLWPGQASDHQPLLTSRRRNLYKKENAATQQQPAAMPHPVNSIAMYYIATTVQCANMKTEVTTGGWDGKCSLFATHE